MVNDKKIQLVKDLISDIKKYSVIGIVNLQNLPAQQLQSMRATLGKKGVKICMARKKLLRMSLEASGVENVTDLIEKLKGMPAILFCDENPYALYATIQKSKSEAPAKAGQEAPRDIVVKAGPTNFAPGPIISELAAVGIKTKVDGGKLTITDDATVAKEGDEITAKLAETLKRLDVKPMEIGLDLVAALEKGFVYKARDLRIDEAEYEQSFISAQQWAFNLAVEVGYPCKETSEVLIQKAHQEAKNLAREAGILNSETVSDVLAKAESEATAIKQEAKLE